jgi:hypothetical protein
MAVKPDGALRRIGGVPGGVGFAVASGRSRKTLGWSGNALRCGISGRSRLKLATRRAAMRSRLAPWACPVLVCPVLAWTGLAWAIRARPVLPWAIEPRLRMVAANGIAHLATSATAVPGARFRTLASATVSW